LHVNGKLTVEYFFDGDAEVDSHIASTISFRIGGSQEAVENDLPLVRPSRGHGLLRQGSQTRLLISVVLASKTAL